jgi:hypothetical protein
MPTEVFHIAAPLFPNYVSWTADTVVRTLAWVGAGLALMAIIAWREFQPSRWWKRDGRSRAARVLRRIQSPQSVATSSMEPTADRSN